MVMFVITESTSFRLSVTFESRITLNNSLLLWRGYMLQTNEFNWRAELKNWYTSLGFWVIIQFLWKQTKLSIQPADFRFDFLLLPFCYALGFARFWKSEHVHTDKYIYYPEYKKSANLAKRSSSEWPAALNQMCYSTTWGCAKGKS